MRKILLGLLICLLFLTGCHDSNDNSANLYHEMIDILQNTNDFVSSSKYFTATFETTETTDGNRYFIVIDNPTMAMYDVDVIAFEQNADTENEFAPNAGIFDSKINLVPNQINKSEGFVKGISISGLYTGDNPVVYCLVQWKDESNAKIYKEFLKFTNQQ